MNEPLPYRIAVLCYLFDARGRVLLLRRSRLPNRHLHSPVGGKLDVDIGESPTGCAVREIHEETGLLLNPQKLHLTGVVSEAAYDRVHWLMFLYEVLGPVCVDRQDCDEGQLAWHEPAQIDQLQIPSTDRNVIWPLFWRYRGRFFMVHIDCRDEAMTWRIEQPAIDAERFHIPPVSG